jgi:hypothetical protein
VIPGASGKRSRLAKVMPSVPFPYEERVLEMPNSSSKAYDLLLKKISHYKSFLAMLPFVGEDYDCASHSKLLIVGESFYFPEDSTSHHDAAKWYSTNQDSLTPDEVNHIHCRGLLECNWECPGHKMYRELNRCLAELHIPSQDRPVSHICFTNAFLRPASHPGKSFKECCADQDVATSISVLIEVIAALAPELIVFTSKYAWAKVGSTVAERFSGIEFHFVSHPTDSFHWNVKSYDHGRKKFVSLLQKWAENAR